MTCYRSLQELTLAATNDSAILDLIFLQELSQLTVCCFWEQDMADMATKFSQKQLNNLSGNNS